MKKKLLISVALALSVMTGLASPALAALNIYGIEYNFNAAENEKALVVKWYGRPWGEVTAGEFRLKKQETTIAEVEQRIKEKFYDLLKEDVPWNQLDKEEEPYISGELSHGEEIVTINNKDYVRYWKGYFSIHIYSLDNPETPESELRFVTQFWKTTVFPGGTTQDEIFPYGWWPN